MPEESAPWLLWRVLVLQRGVREETRDTPLHMFLDILVRLSMPAKPEGPIGPTLLDEIILPLPINMIGEVLLHISCVG